jgi:hypothetical protein
MVMLLCYMPREPVSVVDNDAVLSLSCVPRELVLVVNDEAVLSLYIMCAKRAGQNQPPMMNRPSCTCLISSAQSLAAILGMTPRMARVVFSEFFFSTSNTAATETLSSPSRHAS